MAPEDTLTLYECVLLCEIVKKLNYSSNSFIGYTQEQRRMIYEKFTKKIIFINNKESDVQLSILFHKNGELMITFRCSESLTDYKTSFNARQINFGNSSVLLHYGYYSAIQSIMPDIIKYVRSSKINGKINLVGHSYGAALSVMCGYLLKNKYPELYINIVSIGTPRVGNMEFIEDYEAKINKSISINTYMDPFPHSPICDKWCFKYKYPRIVGPMLLIDENDETMLLENPDDFPKKSCMFRMMCVLRWVIFGDHPNIMKNYHALDTYKQILINEEKNII